MQSDSPQALRSNLDAGPHLRKRRRRSDTSRPSNGRADLSSDGRAADGSQHTSVGQAKPPLRADDNLIIERRGIYEIVREPLTLFERLPFGQLGQDLRELRHALPALKRLALEVWTITPALLLLYVVLQATQSAFPAMRLYMRKQLLDIVQSTVETRELDRHALVYVFVSRLLLHAFEHALSYYTRRVTRRLDMRIQRVFDGKLFRAKLRLDLPSLEDEGVRRQLVLAGLPSYDDVASGGSGDGGPSVGATGSPHGTAGPGGKNGGGWRKRTGNDAFSALQTSMRSLTSIFELVAEAGMLVSLTRNRSGDVWLAASIMLTFLLDLSALKPDLRGNYWARNVNAASIRSTALHRIALGQQWAMSVIAGGLGGYLTREHEVCSIRLDPIEPGGPRELYSQRPVDLVTMLQDALETMPTILFALQAATTPKAVPMSYTTFMLVKQSSFGLSLRLRRLADTPASLSSAAGKIRALYDSITIERRVISGPLQYEPGKPMSIECRHVSFRYPGAPRDALNDISFSIEHGQAVCIIGLNGSGKSTLMKLLARLYEPDEGVILINGVDSREYDPASLQRGLGLLFQESPRFPLTIAESIALGNVHSPLDRDDVRRAADLAGATEFIDRLPHGFDTSLDHPQQGTGNVRSTRMRGGDQPAFMRRGREEQERYVEFSGGQKSKVALAGLMTRIDTADLLILDEPSSALDAKAERDLFRTLLDRRGDKTLIFITHRLGLCQLADQIILLEDSRVVETGTHVDLLARGGLYADLYRSSLDSQTPLGQSQPIPGR